MDKNVELKQEAVEQSTASSKEKDIMELRKPITFEGQEIKELDLTPLRELRGADLIQAKRMLDMTGNASVMYERTLEYACYVCAVKLQKPVDLFQNLYASDAMRLRRAYLDFLY